MNEGIRWDHKDEWRKRGSHCMVTVSRHTVAAYRIERSKGTNRWAVYAWIYPDHPRFVALTGPNDGQSETNLMPLHGGSSLFQLHYDKTGTIDSVQVGADYDHLHDEHFTFMSLALDACQVFVDADRLLEWLEKIEGSEG